VGLNAVLTSLLYKKHLLKLNLLVDPKKSGADSFNKIERHYLAKPDTEDAFLQTTPKSSILELPLCGNGQPLLKDAMVRKLKNTMINLRPEN
jgi:hypothetical protein